MTKKLNITVVGAGYVGLANAMLLAQQHNVTILVRETSRTLEPLQKGICPIEDSFIQTYMDKYKHNWTVTTDKQLAYQGYPMGMKLNDNGSEETRLSIQQEIKPDYILICTNTDYNPDTHKFDTSSISEVMEDIKNNTPILKKSDVWQKIIIRSTIPVGFTDSIIKQYGNHRWIGFMPEFLREGTALYDNLYPSRIILGSNISKESFEVINLFNSLTLKKEENPSDMIIDGTRPKSIYSGSIIQEEPNQFLMQCNTREAEAVKLFSNSFLAMKIAYINELENFCYKSNINTEDVIIGMSSDPRIGNVYNNPSFGYGGYCLPKDTKELLHDMEEVGSSTNMLQSIIQSNENRKEIIAQEIISKSKGNPIGIYRLTMKSGSDNFRSSAMLDIIKIIRKLEKEKEIAKQLEKGEVKSNKSKSKQKIVIYEPTIMLYPSLITELVTSYEVEFIDDIQTFLSNSSIVVANRVDNILEKELEKKYKKNGLDIDNIMDNVYTKDIFRNN